MTGMKDGALPEDIALCAQAGCSAVELRKGTLLRYLRGGGTLEALRQSGRHAMVVFTKGDLLDQQNKVRRSNLAPLFDDVVAVSDKTQAEYAKLCRLFDTQIDHMLMVGNSFRSDIEPVLQLGGWAVHIPFTSIWRHEQTEEYDHPRLARITHFGQLTNLVDAERG